MKLEDEAEVLIAELSDVLVFQSGHVDTVHDDASGVGRVECAHDLQERCLAGSRGTDDADDLAFVDVEVDAFEHLQRAKTFGNILYFDHFRAYFFNLIHQSTCSAICPLSCCLLSHRGGAGR